VRSLFYIMFTFNNFHIYPHSAHKPGKHSDKKKPSPRCGKQISVRLLFILFIAESLFCTWRTFVCRRKLKNIIETINCYVVEHWKSCPGLCVFVRFRSTCLPPAKENEKNQFNFRFFSRLRLTTKSWSRSQFSDQSQVICQSTKVLPRINIP